MLRFSRVLVSLIFLGAGCVGVTAQTRTQLIASGKAIAMRHCSACHALGSSGASPLRAAPPFRLLKTRYDLDNLQEAFVEGIAVGHRGAEMPEFQFTPDATEALIAFLKSLKR